MLNPKDFEKRVADAKKAGKRSEIVDGDGLYLDVTATGVTTWRYRYRVNGCREKITIGSLSDIGLAAARIQRAIIAGKAATAGNTKEALSPAQERQKDKVAKRAAKKAGTIADLGSRYLAHLRKQGRKALSIEWHINAYITPELGAIPTPTLTRDDIRRLCDKIKVKAPSSSREVLGTMKRMMKYAILDGLIETSPAATLDPRMIATKEARERSLSADELRTLVQSIDGGKLSPLVAAALRLILLTMTRKNEVLKAPWTEFDIDASLWELPPGRTKNKKPHMVPLSTQAIAILKTIRPDSNDEDPITNYSTWVIPGRSGKPMSDATINTAMKQAQWFGLQPFTVHDLRRTASTILHEQGWNTDVIEKALNHTMPGVRGVYNRAEYLDKRREMLQAWADYLDALKKGAKVIPIGKSKTAA
jgi:integrase